MPIPQFDADTGYLPAGNYRATLEEVKSRYGTGFRRRQLLSMFDILLGRLSNCGVSLVYIAGSFVTDKQRPGDIDVIYDSTSATVDHDCLRANRLLFDDRHHNKTTIQMDVWELPSWQPPKAPGGRRLTIKEYFESDETGVPKGILELVQPWR